MEDRRRIHDPRNTVKLPNPGRKNLRKRRALRNDPRKPLKLMERSNKIAIARICVWCGMDQQEPRAVCRFCRTCQYCGLEPVGSHACEFCGNKDPDRKPAKAETIRARFGRSKQPKIKNRTQRQIGPQTRDRRPMRTDTED